MKRSLPYKTFYSGSSYSAAYNSYNFCDRNKLFAVLNLPVNCPLGSWYFDIKYALKVYQRQYKKEINNFRWMDGWMDGYLFPPYRRASYIT